MKYFLIGWFKKTASPKLQYSYLEKPVFRQAGTSENR